VKSVARLYSVICEVREIRGLAFVVSVICEIREIRGSSLVSVSSEIRGSYVIRG
jgi:hypothetical protein